MPIPVCAELKREGHRLRLAVTVQALRERLLRRSRRAISDVRRSSAIASGERIPTTCGGCTSRRTRSSIPGGVAPPRRSRAADEGPLRIGYVGRLEQLQKRVLDLPPFADELERRGIPFTLDVAGDGTAVDELRARLPRARFHGWLSTAELYEPHLSRARRPRPLRGMGRHDHRAARGHGPRRRAGGLALHRRRGLRGRRQRADVSGRRHRRRGGCRRAPASRPRTARATLRAPRANRRHGIRSEQGAIDAWAAAFRETRRRAPRASAALPAGPEIRGCSTRLGISRIGSPKIVRARPPPRARRPGKRMAALERDGHDARRLERSQVERFPAT